MHTKQFFSTLVMLTLPACLSASTIPTLGGAGAYAVFALNPFQYNGPGSIMGNVDALLC